MTRKFLLAIASIAMIFSISTLNAQETKDKKECETLKMEVSHFAEKADGLVGKEVEISGMVTHVCKHGGKKMFLMSDDPDVQVKIITGEKVAAFPAELEGSNVWVVGIVEAEEIEVEEDHEEGEEHEEDEDHKNIYHVKQYSISCLKYKVVEK